MNEFAGKKLLVLAGNDVHLKIVKAAQELGIYTIVTDYLSKEESPCKEIADEYWDLSTNDVDAVVEKCRQEHVDGVVDYCIDTVQKAYQEICEKLNVPCFASAELFETFTNKRKFKSFCKKYGVGVIPEYSEEDIHRDKVVYPVLIKPSDSRGSIGITVCNSKEETVDAIEFAKSQSHDHCAIIERYMYGVQDMAFTYMIIGGTPYLIKIGDRVVGREEDGLQCQQMATILPSRNVAEYKAKVEQNVIKMLKATGMHFGVIFMQGFWENGQVYMYDPGLRFPGTEFDIVTKAVTGFDSMKTIVAYAVSGNEYSCFGDPSLAYGYGGGICMIFSISCASGKIAEFEGFDIISTHPSVFSSRKMYTVDDFVPASHDIRQRVAEFVIYVKNIEEANLFVSFVYQNLHIRNTQGEDMIISKIGKLS